VVRNLHGRTELKCPKCGRTDVLESPVATATQAAVKGKGKARGRSKAA
jgi:phage FluMu protein Com